jgi:hypothetical protein
LFLPKDSDLEPHPAEWAPEYLCDFAGWLLTEKLPDNGALDSRQRAGIGVVLWATWNP